MHTAAAVSAEWLSYCLLSITFCLLCAAILHQCYDTRPPGPWGLPFVGVLPRLFNGADAVKTIFGWAEEYGDIFSMRMGTYNVVFLNSPELIHEAFVKRQDYLSDRPVHLRMPKQLFHNRGLVWHNGEDFLNLRRFALTVLKDFGVGTSTLQEKIQDEISVTVMKIAEISGTPFCPKHVLRTAMSNTMTEIVFGSRFDETQADLLNALYAAEHLQVKDASWMLGNYLPWLRHFRSDPTPHHRGVNEKIRELIQSQISHHRVTYDGHVIRDFVDLYVKMNKSHGIHTETVSEENMIRAIADLFVAGSDVTAIVLHWAIFYMITYPDVQEKCRDEIHKFVGQDRLPNMSDKIKLVYTEATLTEIQRLSNTIPFSVPHEVNQNVTLHGYRLRHGTIVYANLYYCHMSSKYWHHANEFLPDRWIDASGNLIHSEAFLPFSLGRRACLGEGIAKMKLFLYFTSLLHTFTFRKGRYRGSTEVPPVMTRLPPEFLVKADSAEVATIT